MNKHQFKFNIKDRYIQSLLPWAVPLLIIILWQLFSSLGWIKSLILPAPLKVVNAACYMPHERKLADTVARILENYCLQWHPNYQKI